MSSSQAIFYGWYVVAAAFVILFAGFGCAYSFGAFFLPLAETFNASRAQTSAVFSYAVSLIFVTGAVSGHLSDRFGPRRIVLLGVIAIALGLVISARAESLRAVLVSFTLGIGLGVGFAYVPAIATVQHWFVRRRALASGIAVTGIGVGTMSLPLLAGHLLQDYQWREVFIVFAVGVLLLSLPAILFLAPDPASRGLHADGAASGITPPTSLASGVYAALLRSRNFWQLYLAQALMSFVILVPFVHIVPSAVDLGISSERAVHLMVLLGAGSTLGRILIAPVADRLGRKLTQSLLFALLGLAYLFWRSASGYSALAWFISGYGVLYGGFIALMPAILADYFAGPKLSSIIGLQYTSAAIGSLIGPITAGFIFDAEGSYSLAFLIATAFCTLAALTLFTTPPPADTNQAAT